MTMCFEIVPPASPSKLHLESRVVSGRLVERATNQTLQTSAVDSVVLSGALVDRVSGQVVQTRPATRIFTLSDGPYALYVPARAPESQMNARKHSVTPFE